MISTVRTRLREAQNLRTTAARLAELALDPESVVRQAVARHATLDAATLAQLLADESWEVRLIAAQNRRAPQEQAVAIVTGLLASEDPHIRSTAAGSRLLTVEQITPLLSDPDAEVRSNAARNSRTPRDLVRGCLTDPEPCVVLGALAHPSVTSDERRAFLTEDLLTRFFETHADGYYLFEVLCERYLLDVVQRAFYDPEVLDDVWQEIIAAHFEFRPAPGMGTVMPAVHRLHWKSVINRLLAALRTDAAKAASSP
jgi:hypothetical protein